VYEKLIKNSQPFGKNLEKPQRGFFDSHCRTHPKCTGRGGGAVLSVIRPTRIDICRCRNDWYVVFGRRKRIVRLTRRSREACRRAVASQWFYWLVIILVSTNTVVFLTEYYRQPYWLDVFQGNRFAIYY